MCKVTEFPAKFSETCQSFSRYLYYSETGLRRNASKEFVGDILESF